MKIIVLGNQARAMCNFWTVLIGQLLAAGHEVVCVIPHIREEDPVWERKLAALGARIARYPLDRKGLNPLRDIRTLFALAGIFRRERCDRLFAYTIKPVIYGAMASSLAGHPEKEHRGLMITGLGYMFEADSVFKRLLTRVAAFLYRFAFSRAGLVFFQNQDDRTLFEKLSILPRSVSIRMSRGCGVDTAHFALLPPPEGPPVFLFVGRLLEAKGLRDLAEAARLVKAAHPEARFDILGPAEKGPGAVPLEEVLAWQEEGIVEYLGETHDVRPYLAKASAVILPSRREGTPTSLLEAMSAGRAVIAADAPGSREVVRQGVNGVLVPAGDARALARAALSFIAEPLLAARMGLAGRELALKEFSAFAVARGVMRDMGIPAASAAHGPFSPPDGSGAATTLASLPKRTLFVE